MRNGRSIADPGERGTGQRPLNDGVKPIAEEKNAGQEQQHTERDLSLTCSSPKFPETYAHDNQPARRRWYRCDKRFVVELGTLAAVISAGLVYYGQLREMRVANDWAVQNTRIGDQASAASLRLTREGLALTRQSNEAAQRAWVVLKGMTPGAFNLTNQPIHIDIHLENVGNSPAIRLTSAATHLVAKTFPASPPYNPPTSEVPGPYPDIKSTLVVGSKAPFRTFVLIQNILPPFIDAVNDGRVKLYIYGRAEYFDQFQVERHTRFCYVYVPRLPEGVSNLNACDVYNEID